jgi:hypothetical protein
MDTNFIIAGPIDGDEPTWYNLIEGWTTEIEQASLFPRAILSDPLPPGGVFFAEIGENYGIVATYTPLPTGGLFWCQKST